MKIKRPLNFVVGIGCGICFVLGIVRGRDNFTVSLYAVLAVANLIFGLAG